MDAPIVTLAKAGIQDLAAGACRSWIPAFRGNDELKPRSGSAHA